MPLQLLLVAGRVSSSIEGPPKSQQRQDRESWHKGREYRELETDLAPVRALEHHGAHDAQEMSHGQEIADVLRPHRHTVEREHKARQ